MDPLTSAAASGMRARIESLDMLANNIANSSSPGFKADREFYGLYLSQEASDSPAGTTPEVMPVIDRPWTDFAQGSVTPTGNPLDLALTGKGFFVANSARAACSSPETAVFEFRSKAHSKPWTVIPSSLWTENPSRWITRNRSTSARTEGCARTGKRFRRSQSSTSPTRRRSPRSAATTSASMFRR